MLSYNKRKVTPLSFDPKLAAYDFSAVTATPWMAVANLQESLMLMQRACQNPYSLS